MTVSFISRCSVMCVEMISSLNSCCVALILQLPTHTHEHTHTHINLHAHSRGVMHELVSAASSHRLLVTLHPFKQKNLFLSCYRQTETDRQSDRHTHTHTHTHTH